MNRSLGFLLVSVAVLGLVTSVQAQSRKDPAPSGNEQSEKRVYQTQDGKTYTITTPGKDAGTVSGNKVDFDDRPQPGAERDTTIIDKRPRQ